MKTDKRALKLLLAGAVAGVLWLGIVRAIFFYPEPVHHHANFAVYLGGERFSFDSPMHYEEVQACTQDEASNPRGRVHMHQPDGDVVHVHDDAVTWGNFFENIGWALGNDFVKTESTMYQDGENGELKLMLNGQTDRLMANRVIGNGDRLLVSFGQNLDQTMLAEQFVIVPNDAEKFNQSYDPAGCSGAQQPSIWQRLRYGFLGRTS